MDPLQIAALIITGVSTLVALLMLFIFAKYKNRQRELLSDDVPPNNQTPDGQHIFHRNLFITVLYVVLLIVGTGVVLYGAFLA